MGPFLFIYVALVGFFAFAALYHLILWWSSRSETLLAVFSADCAVRAALSGALVAVATATTPAEAYSAMRARIAIGMLMLVVWLWNLSQVSGVRARWFVWPVTAVLLLALPIHALVMPLNPPVIAVHQALMPWGETIYSPQLGPAGWWVRPLYAIGVAIAVFGVVCGARLWRHDRMAGALVVTTAMGTIAVLAVEVLRSYSKVTAPYIGVIPQIFWVSALAFLIARGHRRTREQLAASEQRFRGIFDQTFQLIGLLTTDGTLIAANRTALEFAGVREQDVVGKPFWQTPWWSHSPELQVRLREAIRDVAGGRMARFEATHPRPDGKPAYIDFSLKPLRDERGVITLLIPEGRDITQRKWAEEERRKLESQIQHAQKLESLGVLAGGIAHDFNNLLTVMLGNASMSLMQLPDDSPACPLLREIAQAAQRAADLTGQMLAYSGKSKFVIRPERLDTLVREMADLLKTVVSKKATVELNLSPATIEGDATQVRQVVMNLIINASESLQADTGAIRIRTGVIHADTADLRSPYVPEELPAGNYAFVEVEDTGCGMSEATLAKIFDPFFTTKFTGRGLGLAAVLGIVRSHRGTIRVTSTQGLGTHFQVYFPSADAVATVEVDRGRAWTPPRGEGTILIVEDEPIVHAFARRVLESAGFCVLTAEDGREGLELFEKHAPQIVAVLLDLTMPRMDGLECLRELRGLAPHLPVLVMSGYSEQDLSVRCLETGASGFIQKPFDPRELVSSIYELLPADASDSPAARDRN